MLSLRQFVDRCQALVGVIDGGGDTAADAVHLALRSIPVAHNRLEALVVRQVLLRLAARMVLRNEPLAGQLASGVLVALALESDDLSVVGAAFDTALRGVAAPIVPSGGDRRSRQSVQRALAIIDERFDDPTLRLATLAPAVNLSPSHLSRSLKRYSGLGFLEHLHRRRVAKACGLLSARSLSVKEVAAAVGYGGTSELDHHFKRLLGVTPTRRARIAHQ